jgi:hypothetical protein
MVMNTINLGHSCGVHMVGKRFMASCNPKKRIDVTNQVTQYPILIPVKPTLGVET